MFNYQSRLFVFPKFSSVLYILSATDILQKKAIKKPGFKLTLKSLREQTLVFEVDVQLFEFNLETLQFSQIESSDREENGWYAAGTLYF